MKGILLLNGQPYTGKIDAKNAYVVCCDGAYLWAHGAVRIDENIGDFDSLSIQPDPPPLAVYPAQKNATDGEIGLDRLLALGCDEIEIYGGGGKREDHFLGNLHLLYRAHRALVRAKMITDRSVLFLAEGKCCVSGKKGTTFSLLPFASTAHIIDGEGIFYSLTDLTLSYGSCRGISNVLTETQATFTVDRGTVLVVVNGEDV